jgi:L-asparaginase
MRRDSSSGALVPAADREILLREIPELQEVADIELLNFLDIDSSNMRPENWLELAAVIFDKLDDFDGFVVAHGTDTLSYTASALSFLLKNLTKPVVITGSQVPLGESTGTDARNNLLFATRFASMDFAEVAVFFGSDLMRGNRCTKYSQFDFHAYRSFNFPQLGRMGLYPRLEPWCSKSTNDLPHLNREIKDRVVVLPYLPGLRPDLILALADEGTQGFVIEGVGPGNLPTVLTYPDVIRSLRDRGIPLVLRSQCQVGGAALDMYETGQAAAAAGAISGQDMTREAAVTKLMWALATCDGVDEVEKVFSKSVAGEVSI